MTRGIINTITYLFTRFFSLIFFIVFLAICIGFVGIALTYFAALPFIGSVGPDSTLLGYLGALAGIFAIGIPMLGFTLFMARKFTPIKVNYRLNNNLFVPWLISMGIFTGATLKTISDYQAHSSASYTNTYEFNPEETLVLDFDEKGYEDYMSIVQLGHLKFYDHKAFSEYVSTHLVPSKEETLTLETEIESRGSSRMVADQSVENNKSGLCLRG